MTGKKNLGIFSTFGEIKNKRIKGGRGGDSSHFLLSDVLPLFFSKLTCGMVAKNKHIYLDNQMICDLFYYPCRFY